MAFIPKKQAYNASINAVTLGVGEKSIVVGGENVLPFYTFDAEIANAPKIAIEISDKGVAALQTKPRHASPNAALKYSSFISSAESEES